MTNLFPRICISRIDKSITKLDGKTIEAECVSRKNSVDKPHMNHRLEIVQKAVKQLEEDFDKRKIDKALERPTCQNFEDGNPNESHNSYDRISIASYDFSLCVSLRSLTSILSSHSASGALRTGSLDQGDSAEFTGDIEAVKDEASPIPMSDTEMKDFEDYQALTKEARSLYLELEPGADSLSESALSFRSKSDSPLSLMNRNEKKLRMSELRALVHDWKGHRINCYGDLLLFDILPISRGQKSNRFSFTLISSSGS